MKYIQINLSYLRALRKVTQREVSQATGISQKTLSTLETGVSQGIEFNTLVKLCTFFMCTPSEILFLEEEPESTPPSMQSLKKADELISRGLQAAMESPQQSVEDIWAEFDALRKQLQSTAQPVNKKSNEKGNYART